MNEVLNNLKKGKYVSFFTLICLAFSYASNFRYYINENVYAAFDLSNLGEFGKALKVSVLVVVCAALGWAIGFLTAFLTGKKKINVVTLYWLSGMFAIVALFFTPYNLQLLMPATIMQNIAMIACIAHVAFILVDVWLFSWAIFVGSREVCAAGGRTGVVAIAASAIVACVLAYVSIVCKWSFVIQVSVYGGIIIFINILNAAFSDKMSEEKKCELRCCDKMMVAVAAVETALFLAVLIGVYFITENQIAIG